MSTEEKSAEDKKLFNENGEPLTESKAKYWIRQIVTAKKIRKEFFEEGRSAYRAYLDERVTQSSYYGEEGTSGKKTNIYNSAITTELPMYYARTPRSEISLRKKVGSLVENIGARALENGLDYLIDESQDFDKVAVTAIESWLITGIGVIWERYEAEESDEYIYEEFDLTRDEQGNLVYLSDGSPFIEGEAEVIESPTGIKARVELVDFKDERVISEFVHFMDYMHSPARDESEITWKAKKAYLTREQLVKNYGDLGRKVKLSASKDLDTLNLDSDAKEDIKRAEVWEIWDSVTKKIYFICPDYPDSELEVIDYPVNLRGKFPCAPALYSLKSPDSAIPISQYRLCKDLVDEIEETTTRIYKALRACRINLLHASEMSDEVREIFSKDLETISVNNFAMLNEKGGMAALMQFTDIVPIVNAIKVLYDSREAAIQKFYELTGNSDIIRGATSDVETATAQQIKGNFAQVRFSLRQRMVQKFLEAQLQIKAEMMCQLFSDDTIREICRVDELVENAEGQVTAQEVIDFIKSNLRRSYTISIQTDSIAALNEDADKQSRNEYLSTVSGFIQQTLPAMQQFPALTPVFMELIKFASRSYKIGVELEANIEKGLQGLIEQAQQASQQPVQPDPKTIESQTKLKIAEMEQGSESQKINAEFQINQLEMSIRDRELQIKEYELQIENKKLDITLMQLQSGQQLDAQGQAMAMSNTHIKVQGDLERETIKRDTEIIKAESVARKEQGDTQQEILKNPLLSNAQILPNL